MEGFSQDLTVAVSQLFFSAGFWVSGESFNLIWFVHLH
jgi:hypothetical protein